MSVLRDRRQVAIAQLRGVAIKLLSEEFKYLSFPDAEDESLELGAMLLMAAALFDQPGEAYLLADGRTLEEAWPKEYVAAMEADGVRH